MTSTGNGNAAAVDAGYAKSLTIGLSALLAAFLIANLTGHFATAQAGPPLNDLILDRLPTLDVNIFHTYFGLVFWLGVALYCVASPRVIPYAAKAFALFFVVRAVFVSLTHLGPPANFLVVQDDLTRLYTFTGDLFFSGHVGGPYLAALMFWHRPAMRWLCLGASIVFAGVVMLGAIHYSIDVLGAYFITYTIHRLSLRFFAADRQRFASGDM